jgi:hypothetical protein
MFAGKLDLDQLGSEDRQSIILPLRISGFNDKILTLNEAMLA